MLGIGIASRILSNPTVLADARDPTVPTKQPVCARGEDCVLWKSGYGTPPHWGESRTRARVPNACAPLEPPKRNTGGSLTQLLRPPTLVVGARLAADSSALGTLFLWGPSRLNRCSAMPSKWSMPPTDIHIVDTWIRYLPGIGWLMGTLQHFYRMISWDGIFNTG